MKALRACKCGKEAHTEEELELFTKNKGLKYGRRNTCKECTSEATRKSLGYIAPKKSAPKGTYTTSQGKDIWKRYGLSEEGHRKMLEKAGNKCELCESTEYLIVDHCHYTNTLRGILCRSCNNAIQPIENMKGDYTQKLKKLLNYVENHNYISHTLPTIEELKKLHVENQLQAV